MPAANPIVETIIGAITGEATAIGGATFRKIQAVWKQRTRAYAKTIEAISRARLTGEFDEARAAEAEADARELYIRSIKAQVQQITLGAVQTFINRVLSAATAAINAALPIPIL